MGQSQRLKLGEVRAVYRLLGEVRELGESPPAWRRHALESLCRLVGGQAGVCAEVLFPGDAPQPVPESFADFNCPGGARWRKLIEYLASREAAGCPAYAAVNGFVPVGRIGNYSRVLKKGTGTSRPREINRGKLSAFGASPLFQRADSRRQITLPVDARYWFSCPLVQLTIEAGLNLPIHSRHPLPAGRANHVISLYRSAEEKSFSNVQTRLVRLFHRELANIWQLPRADRLANLPPRLRQTLDALLAGDSEKQIALRLAVSPHTVHNNVKELHRRFDVSSRGELLSRFIDSARCDFVPRLTTPRHCLPEASRMGQAK